MAGMLWTRPGEIVPGVYVTGWIKRGPVGLIGNTKSDAKETTDMLIADALAGRLTPRTATGDITEYLEAQGIPYTTWDGWHKLDAHERSLGSAEGRERKRWWSGTKWSPTHGHRRLSV